MELELLGYLGGLLIAISLLPQLIKAWKTKSTNDLSILWTMITLSGLILYTVYAAVNQILPLLTFAIIESIMIITLISMKLVYDKK